jgi:tRNA A37 threonylcarbamoyladenosine synthetase subunit TsaC/SUA5/YrdC
MRSRYAFALVDLRTGEPLADVSANRQGEPDAVTSKRLRRALEARHVRLMTYRELIDSRTGRRCNDP